MARTLAEWWNDRSLRWKGIIVLAVPMTALLAITGVFMVASSAAEASARKYADASRVTNAIDNATNHLSAAQAGLRGYLLTHDVVFLDSFHRVLADLPAARAEVVGAFRDHRGHENLVGQLVDGFDRTIDLSMQILDAGAADASGVDRLLMLGETTVSRLRVIGDQIRRDGAEAIESAEAARRRWAGVARTMAWLGIVVGALGGVVGSTVFTRSIARRVRRTSENAELLVRGEPLLPAPEGKDEVGRSGTALVEAARQIRDAERKVAEHREDLERSNQELERFAYVASHDLQEPLRMVASHVQLLAADLEGTLGPDQEESMGFAVDGAKRMQRLINDLLTYSRVGRRGKPPEPTDLGEMFDTALQNLQVTLREQGASVTHGDLPVLDVDAGQMVQLLQNLIGNAVKFRREEAPRVHVSASAAGSEWTVTVEDNGIGVPVDQAERVFQIFQRLHTREEYEGTGIGLAVCRRIVERHGGHIWIEPGEEVGSRVRFTIPGAPAERAA
jgi:signal transduction histidine kinase